MAAPVHFVVDLAINEGKLDAFQAIANDMIARTRNEAGALAYEWYLSADQRRCRVFEIYQDVDAVNAHLNGYAVRELIPKLVEHVKLDRFEVYGDPGPKAAASLKSFGAEIFSLWQGLGR